MSYLVRLVSLSFVITVRSRDYRRSISRDLVRVDSRSHWWHTRCHDFTSHDVTWVEVTWRYVRLTSHDGREMISWYLLNWVHTISFVGIAWCHISLTNVIYPVMARYVTSYVGYVTRSVFVPYINAVYSLNSAVLCGYTRQNWSSL